MPAPQLLPAPFPSLHDSTYRHCFGLVYDVRSGGVSSDSALPLVGSQRPSRRTQHLSESCFIRCIRISFPHDCAYRNCATHLAEWCPPCYYVAGPLTTIVEPYDACVAARDLLDTPSGHKTLCEKRFRSNAAIPQS